MAEIRRILVPVDFSPFSKRAFRAAVSLAQACGATVELLHVIPEYEVESAFHIGLPGRTQIEANGARWADRAYDDYLRGEAAGSVEIRRAVRYGNPARVICEYASEVGADLILIASHGRSGFERAVFGSVAEKVLRIAAQPVMVVKGPP